MIDKPNLGDKEEEISESATSEDLSKNEVEEPRQEIMESSSGLEEEKLKEELANTKDRYLRLAAEFENYKKISQREQQNSIRFANESLINSLLPVLDNLEHAIAAQKKISTEKNDILVGVELVFKQLLDTLLKYGVEPFHAQGLPFDPARHDAVNEQEDDTAKPGTVVVEYQRGYLLNGRLLRPARVAVAKSSGKASCDL